MYIRIKSKLKWEKMVLNRELEIFERKDPDGNYIGKVQTLTC